jgi:hypothetical protein
LRRRSGPLGVAKTFEVQIREAQIEQVSEQSVGGV